MSGAIALEGETANPGCGNGGIQYLREEFKKIFTAWGSPMSHNKWFPEVRRGGLSDGAG